MSKDRTYTFDMSLVVVSERNIDEVVKILNFEDFSFIRKGERISKIIEPSDKNIYSYTQKCDSISEYETSILNFLNDLEKRKQEIVRIRSRYDVYIKIFFQSDYAQMQFELPKKFFEIVNKLGLKCKFSLLSWGEVE